MRVLIINQHRQDLIGGSEIQCDIIANNLQKRGHDITYFAVNGQMKKYTTNYNVVPVNKRYVRKLIKTLKEYQSEIIYWRHNKKRLLVTSIVSRLLGVKFVYSISHLNDVLIWPEVKNRYYPDDENGLFSKAIRIKRKFGSLYKNIKGAINYLAIPLLTDGVISLNEDLLNNIKKKEKITIHNSYIESSKEFSWGKPNIVWVANIKGSKNPEKYIFLAKIFCDINIDFLMIGDIQDVSYKSIIEDAPSNLKYLGKKSPEEVNGILYNSLFLVHTCYPEGFCGNFIQAWSQGKPTISLYFDPEGIIERENIGFYSGNFEQFVIDTRTLIQNDKLRNQMGNRAKEVALRLFNPDENVKVLETFLSNIVES